jgi:hypothetical protein
MSIYYYWSGNVLSDGWGCTSPRGWMGSEGTSYDFSTHWTFDVVPCGEIRLDVGEFGCVYVSLLQCLIVGWSSIFSNRFLNIVLFLLNPSGLKRHGTVCHNIESPQCYHDPGPSVLGSPDPRRTETFVYQSSSSRLLEPTPLTDPSPTTTLQ